MTKETYQLDDGRCVIIEIDDLDYGVTVTAHPAGENIGYMKFRREGFTRFLDDGRICLTNNAAERALQPLALGRKSWLFAGSDHGGERTAVMYTLIATAKLNDVDPQAWLADVLARIAELPHTRVHELLPWNWKAAQYQTLAA